MKKAPVYVRKLQVLDPPFRLDIHLWMATISYIFTVCLLIYCLVGRQPKCRKRVNFGSILGQFGSIWQSNHRKRVNFGSIWVNSGQFGSRTIEKGSILGQLGSILGRLAARSRKMTVWSPSKAGRVVLAVSDWRYPKFRPLTLPTRDLPFDPLITSQRSV
jgi:hypothetical protein